MAAKADKAAISFGDKILHNAIAADAAITILQQKLLKLLEYKSIMFYDRLKQQIEDIHENLDPVYEFLTKHPEKGEKVEWKSELLEAVYKIEDNIDKFRSRIAKADAANVMETTGNVGSLSMFQILYAKCSLSKCLQEFKHRMTNLKKDEFIPNKDWGSLKEQSPPRRDPTEWDKLFSLDIAGTSTASRDSNMETLKTEQIELQDGKDKIRVIVGEQGSGKTFLARSFFLQQHHNFDCCAWVNVSKMTNVDDILQSVQKQIWNSSTLVPHVEPQPKHSETSFNKALFGKRYLIVLDDVWDFSLLWYVVESLPDSNCGACLLITTQDKLLGIFDPRKIKLGRLNDIKSEELMKSKSNIAGKHFVELIKNNDLKNALLKKCRGSPLRINLLVGLIAKSTNSTEVIQTIPDTDNLEQLFAHCYNRMRKELKPCFLYMTLFPKLDSIPVRRLLRLWLAEGFLAVPKGAEMEPEDLGMDYLKELVFRNLIEAVEWKEDGSPRRVRVITCIYDLFHSGAIGTELLYVNTQKETEKGEPLADQNYQSLGRAASRFRWLVELSNIKELSLSPVAKISYLRTFLSFNWREGILTRDIGNFLELTVSGKHSNLLTVLDLEGVYKPNLDKVLGKLVLLKHLGLRATALGSLPKSIADLPYLETLDLKYTTITELPKSFWKNSKILRHLYLNSYCRIDRNTFSSSSASSPFTTGTGTKPFEYLHTLSGAVVDSIAVEEVEGKQTIVGLRHMKKLTKLGILFQYNKDNYYAIGDWISSLTNLQSLKLGIIKSRKASELPTNLSFLQHHSLSKLYLLGKFSQECRYLIPQTLIILTLSKSEMSPDHILQLGNLPNLKVLNLKADSFTRPTLTFSKNCFQNLQVLRMWMLQEIETLDLTECKLPNIKTIEFRSCPKMDNIRHIQDMGGNRKETILLRLVNMQSMFVSNINGVVDKSKIKVKTLTFKEPQKASQTSNASTPMEDSMKPSMPAKDQNLTEEMDGDGHPVQIVGGNQMAILTVNKA